MGIARTGSTPVSPTSAALPWSTLLEMPARHRFVLVFALLVAGVVLGLVVRASLPPPEAAWDAQVGQDALTLLEAVKVRPDHAVPLDQEFWDAWDRRREHYPPERLEELRRILDAYLDFLLAEHADAAEIYTAGDDRVLSERAAAARRALTEAFGPAAAQILADADRLRDDAYRASPVVAPGTSDLPDYRMLYRAVEEQMPLARERVVELTAPK